MEPVRSCGRRDGLKAASDWQKHFKGPSEFTSRLALLPINFVRQACDCYGVVWPRTLLPENRVTNHPQCRDVGLHREPSKTCHFILDYNFLMNFYLSCTDGKRNKYSTICLLSVLIRLITSYQERIQFRTLMNLSSVWKPPGKIWSSMLLTLLLISGDVSWQCVRAKGGHPERNS